MIFKVKRNEDRIREEGAYKPPNEPKGEDPTEETKDPKDDMSFNGFNKTSKPSELNLSDNKMPSQGSYFDMVPAVDYLSYEPHFLYKEFAKEQEERIRATSRFGHLKSWKLARLIVKSGDDMRLEQFAMQLIALMDSIFKRKNLNLWLKPYEILATAFDSGVIEFCEDSLGLDFIRKTMSEMMNRSCDLYDYFRKNFGSPT